MNYSEQDSELFDRYLSGTLDEATWKAFEERLREDAAFAEAFRVHTLLTEGIKANARMELKQHLRENADIQYWGGNMWPRSMRFAAAAALLIFSAVYLLIRFYVNPAATKAPLAHTETGPAAQAPVHSPSDTLYPTEEPELAQLSKPAAPPMEIQAAEAETADIPSPIEDTEKKSADIGNVYAAEADMGESPQVLREIKLLDTMYQALVINSAPVASKMAAAESKTYNNYALSRKKSSKAPSALNNSRQAETQNREEPDSGAKQLKHPAPVEKLQVQYWSSPVNFKGYSYAGTELRLYSLNPYKVKLLILDKVLYLLYEGTVFRLDPCSSACAFAREPDSDIAETIRTHTP